MGPTGFETPQAEAVTTIHPLALAMLAVAVVFLLCVRREQVVGWMFLMTLLVTAEQGISVAGASFYFYRVLVLVACLRITLRSEWKGLKLNALDKVLLAFVLVTGVAFVALRGDTTALVNRLGFAIDYAGFYLVLRALIRDFDDILRIVNTLIAVTVVVAVGVVLEQTLHRNLFGVFSGNTRVYWRQGSVRSMAAFAHPIAVGVFGASMVPLCLGRLMGSGRKRPLHWIGLFCAVTIVAVSRSSGPLLALVAAVLACSMYGFRRHIKAVRFTAVAGLVGLHLAMKAPVWALIGRVGVFGGSTSYHRYMLVDQAIRRVREWWLFGVMDTGHWGHPSLQLWDVANQYVRVAVDGGLMALVLFLTFLILSFKGVGLATKNSGDKHPVGFMFWSFGAALFTHVTAFIGVSYALQLRAVLMFTVAACSLAYELSVEKTSDPQPVPAARPGSANASQKLGLP